MQLRVLWRKHGPFVLRVPLAAFRPWRGLCHRARARWRRNGTGMVRETGAITVRTPGSLRHACMNSPQL